MPCNDGGYGNGYAEKQAKWFEALACGIFTQMDKQPIDGLLNDILDNLDYQEMGINRLDVEFWWKSHKSADEKRRAEEAQKAQIEELRILGLSKLTQEERKALGL